MTGWTYQTSKSLYFGPKKLTELTPKERTALLEGLYTYTNLLNDWKTTGLTDLANSLMKMIKDVEAGTGLLSIKQVDFDNWFAGTVGAIRAKIPYSYYAVKFASAASELTHPDKTSHSELAKALDEWLSGMRNAIPKGVYDVIRHDIKKLPDTPPRQDAVTGQNQHNESWYKTRTWSDLVLGTISVRDTLNRWGRSLLYIAVGAVGIALFSFVGGVIASPFIIIPYILNVNLGALTLSVGKDLFTTIQTFVATLSAVGLSLSLLASKAMNGVKAFEPWAGVQLARFRRLRKDSYRQRRKRASLANLGLVTTCLITWMESSDR